VRNQRPGPLVGLQRAHLELYLRHLHDDGLRDSSINTMLHAVHGFFRFAHIHGLIAADPAVDARLTTIHADETRTQGLDRLEPIRFLHVAQTLTVHHDALAYLLGINPLRATETAAVRIEDYAETLRGHRVLHLVGKGNKPATMPLTVPVLRGPGGLPRPTHHRAADPAAHVGKAGRPARRLPDGAPESQGRRHPQAHQPPLPAPRRHHQRPRRRRPAARRADPRREADPRTTQHYDRARGNLNRHGVHFLTAYVAGV